VLTWLRARVCPGSILFPLISGDDLFWDRRHMHVPLWFTTVPGPARHGEMC